MAGEALLLGVPAHPRGWPLHSHTLPRRAGRSCGLRRAVAKWGEASQGSKDQERLDAEVGGRVCRVWVWELQRVWPDQPLEAPPPQKTMIQKLT